MAPRRKRTSRKAQSTRAKPTLPEGRLDSSMTVEEKENKVMRYLNDYKLQAQINLDQMNKCISQVNSLFTSVCRNVLIGVPKDIREMTMEEFLRKGGMIDTALSGEITEDVADLACRSLPLKHISSNTSNMIHVKESQPKEASQVAVESNVKAAGKTTRKRKVRIADETPAPSKRLATTTATRSSRRLQAKHSMITPTTNNQSVFQTPFITPKFDPRLPITPALLREPKAGERIVSMSGSPLTNPAGPITGCTPQIFIPLKGGKTMQLSLNDKTSQVNQFYMNDNIALKNIKLIQEKLASLLKVPENMQIS